MNLKNKESRNISNLTSAKYKTLENYHNTMYTYQLVSKYEDVGLRFDANLKIIQIT